MREVRGGYEGDTRGIREGYERGTRRVCIKGVRGRCKRTSVRKWGARGYEGEYERGYEGDMKEIQGRNEDTRVLERYWYGMRVLEGCGYEGIRLLGFFFVDVIVEGRDVAPACIWCLCNFNPDYCT